MLWQSNTRSPLTFALSAVILKAGGKIFFFPFTLADVFFFFVQKFVMQFSLLLNSLCEELGS